MRRHFTLSLLSLLAGCGIGDGSGVTAVSSKESEGESGPSTGASGGGSSNGAPGLSSKGVGTYQSVAFSNLNDALLLTVSGGLNAYSYTFLGQGYMDANTGTYTFIACVDNTNTRDQLGMGTNGDIVQVFATWGSNLSGNIATVSPGQWFGWALVGGGTSSAATLTGYIYQGGALTSQTVSAGAKGAVTQLLLGGNTFNELAGNIAEVRVWNVPLSAAQLVAEFQSHAPVITSGLQLYNDFSGNNLGAQLVNKTANASWATVAWSESGSPQSSTLAPTLSGSVSPQLSVSLLIADMGQNSFVLQGYEGRTSGFYVHGVVQSGARFNMQYPASWDTTQYPAGQYQGVMPWLVVFNGESENNATANERVEVGEGAIYILRSSTNQWVLVDSGFRFTGGYYKKDFSSSTQADEIQINEADGTYTGGKPPADNQYVWHAWCSDGVLTVPFDSSDAIAVQVRCKARLIVADSSQPDIRSSSQWALQMGADNYVNSQTSWESLGYSIAPGLGAGRAKQLSSDWQWFTFTTITDGGIEQDPGGQYPRGGITQAQLQANPPPLS